MKKVLITGSNGLLGQALLDVYRKFADCQLYAMSKGPNRYPHAEGYTYFDLDLTNDKGIRDVFSAIEPDVVINTAALTNVDACEEQQALCDAINVKAVGHMLAACDKERTHFIHLSTDFVFDGKNGPYVETDEPNPLSYYAKSKLASEMLVQMSEYKNWAIARTIIVYGSGNDLSRSNIVEWSINALSNDQELTIVDDQFRSPTYAPDLAMGCRLIEQKRANGIYHVSGPEVYSMYEMVVRIARFIGKPESLVKPIKSDQLKRPAPRPMKTGFSIEKAKNDLEYDPIDLEASLKEMLSGQLN